jgi:elongation factor P
MRAGDLKVGTFIEIEGRIYEVVDVERQKVAQRQPHIKTKLKETITGKVIERTFVSSDELKSPDVSLRYAKFLYSDGDEFVFIDSETYEEYRFKSEALKDIAVWFIEGVEFQVIVANQSPIAIRLPKVIELEVVDTPPGIRGDTESGGIKPATLSNGVVIQVPLHVKKGERIKVNPEKNEYLGRA